VLFLVAIGNVQLGSLFRRTDPRREKMGYRVSVLAQEPAETEYELGVQRLVVERPALHGRILRGCSRPRLLDTLGFSVNKSFIYPRCGTKGFAALCGYGHFRCTRPV
jgi:hypothetical protein